MRWIGNQELGEMFWHGSRIYSAMLNRQLNKGPARTRTTVLFVIVLFLGVFISVRWIDDSIRGASKQKIVENPIAIHKHPQRIEIPLNCSAGNRTRSCPVSFSETFQRENDDSSPSSPVCPDYFPWIHEDLETFKKSFQTRDVFTLWGISQMLNRYPGRLPDLELMFDCVDWPVVQTRHYRGPNATAPPPLFRYCGDDSTLDIVFPDWSFWGW